MSAWWRNQQAHSQAEVTGDGKRFKVFSRESDGARREELWSRIVRIDPAYAEYQRRTQRRLAVVVLDPI